MQKKFDVAGKLFFRILSNWMLRALPTSHFHRLKRALLNSSGLKIEMGARVNGGTQFLGRGEVSVGADTWIGPNCTFYTHVDVPINIGSRCDIAPEVCFIPGSHNIGPTDRRAGMGWAQPIEIGAGCWIGARVTILGGVNIGAGSIVAAGALVASDVPSNSVVGGVPARLIRQL